MLKIIKWQGQKPPPVWLWFLSFIISIAGIFIFGLNLEYLQKYWAHLAIYNITLITIAVFYITKFIVVINKRKKQNIAGSKFIISLVKIIPILTLVPILSFYAFSFQIVQDNLQLAAKNVDNLNTTIYDEAKNIYQDLKIFEAQEYINISTNILKIVHSFITYNTNNKKNLNNLLNELTINHNVCNLNIFIDNKKFSQSKILKNCHIWEDYKLSNKLYSIEERNNKNTVITQLPLKSIKNVKENIILVAFYRKNTQLQNTITRIDNFQKGIKDANITLNSSIIKKQFLIDFSTTILLTLLSVLVIVLKMMDKIIIPLNNLSTASKKISSGEYGVIVAGNNADSDIKNLIEEFNAMSLQIKQAKTDIDNKNLYLGMVIKYSSGIIAIDKNYKINLINDKLLAMFNLKSYNLIGENLLRVKKYNIKIDTLFSAIIKNFTNSSKNWNETIKFEQLLLDIQGATLVNNNKIIGYMLIIKDISNIRKAEKLSAWNEVAKRMAHEIKNPLNPILLSAQRLRNKFLQNNKKNTEISEIIDKTTNTIISQVNSISAMVNAFAEYNNDSKLEYKQQNLNTIIKNTVPLYDDEYNIILNLDKITTLNLDTNSINRVLINLIKNSIEAKNKKNKLIIQINTKEEENIVILEVIDNGIGFDNSIINEIFEPYITNKKTGSGLGMAIIEKIIRQHNATIKIDKNYHNGAKIIISFKKRPSHKYE